MARIADTAKVTMRGGDIPEPDSESGQVILGAWQVYRWVSARAMREGAPSLRDGVDGHMWKGSLDDAFHALWPFGRPPLKDEPWDDGMRVIRNWLIASGNIGVGDRGRPGTSTRREGVIAPRAPLWWVRGRFAGAPEGMALPDLDDSGRPVPALPAALAHIEAAPPPAPPAPEEDPWWCPFTLSANCQLEGPYTREELGIHIQRVHKFSKSGGMYQVYIDEAAAIRENRRDAPPPPPPPPALPEPPPRGIIEMVSEPSEPAPAPVAAPAPAPVRAPARTRAAVPVGSLSGQARAFASMVAEMEDREASHLRRIRELEEENRRLREQAAGRSRLRLSETELKFLAGQLKSLVTSKDGD